MNEGGQAGGSTPPQRARRPPNVAPPTKRKHDERTPATAVGEEPYGVGAASLPVRAPLNERRATRARAPQAPQPQPSAHSRRTPNPPQHIAPTKSTVAPHCSSSSQATPRRLAERASFNKREFVDIAMSVDEHDRGARVNGSRVEEGASGDSFGAPGSRPAAQASVGPTQPPAPTVPSHVRSVIFSDFVFGSGSGLGASREVWLDTHGLEALVRELQRPCECEVETACSRWSSSHRRCHEAGVGVHSMVECRHAALDRWWIQVIVGSWAVRCVS